MLTDFGIILSAARGERSLTQQGLMVSRIYKKKISEKCDLNQGSYRLKQFLPTMDATILAAILF